MLKRPTNCCLLLLRTDQPVLNQEENSFSLPWSRDGHSQVGWGQAHGGAASIVKTLNLSHSSSQRGGGAVDQKRLRRHLALIDFVRTFRPVLFTQRRLSIILFIPVHLPRINSASLSQTNLLTQYQLDITQLSRNSKL